MCIENHKSSMSVSNTNLKNLFAMHTARMMVTKIVSGKLLFDAR